jgi:hypothetical protein
MTRTLAILTVAALIAGCANPEDQDLTPVPVEGSAYRISPPTVSDGSELTVDIMTTRRRCKEVHRNPDDFDKDHFSSHEERLDACVPKVDRASGQVQLSFRLAQRDNRNKMLMLPLEQDHVEVAHMEQGVANYELLQYNPSRAGQLFILMIDHSQSMRITDDEGINRMQRVQNAIWANRDTFVNDESAIAMFRFTSEVAGMGGENWQEVVPIQDPARFKEELGLMGQVTGWTHLYAATELAVGPLLGQETQVSRFLAEHDMQPTVVVLTDGFNNTNVKEVCGDNAKPLSDALSRIRQSRRKPPSKRPVVYTVGFGKGFRPAWEPPQDDISVTPQDLCGDLADSQIDRGLDQDNIDNVSLQWLAEVGGGKGFIRANHKELKDVFAETAPKRYKWYQVRYRVDPQYHRTAFSSTILIKQFATARASAVFHPSAWFDAPTGRPPKSGGVWVERGDIRRATAFTVPVLGAFLFLTFFGPAVFNMRRALFRRSRKSGKGR